MKSYRLHYAHSHRREKAGEMTVLKIGLGCLVWPRVDGEIQSAGTLCCLCSLHADINHPGPERRLVEGPPLVLILGGAVPAMTVRALSKRYFLKAPLTFDEGDHLAGGRFYDCDAFSNFHVAVIF